MKVKDNATAYLNIVLRYKRKLRTDKKCSAPVEVNPKTSWHQFDHHSWFYKRKRKLDS